MEIITESPSLSNLVTLMILLVTFLLLFKMIKNFERLIFTVIGLLMGLLIARHFPVFVEQIFTLIEGSWKTAE